MSPSPASGFWKSASIASMGIAVTCALALAQAAADRRELADRYGRLAAQFTGALEHSLEVYLRNQGAINSYFTASERVTAAEFTRFVEQIWQGSGVYQYFIYAPRRGAELPVAYLEPRDWNDHLLGVDLAADAELGETLRRAVDSAAPAATTPRLRLVGGEAVALQQVVMPHYSRADWQQASVEDRRASLSGVSLGAYRLGAIVEELIARNPGWDQTLELFAGQAGDSPSLYVHAAQGADPAPAATLAEALRRPGATRQGLRLAQQTATVVLTPATPPALSDGVGANVYLILALGAALSVLLQFYVIRRREARTAALGHELLHKTIMDSNLDALVATSDSGVVLEWSHTAERVFGWSAREAVGRPLAELVLPDGRKALSLTAPYAKPASGYRPTEGALRRRDGAEFPAEIVLAPAQLPGGEGRLFIFVRDISERRRTEEQLRQTQKMEAMGQLTGGLAHDFNNMLGIIVGNLDLLIPQLGDDAKAKKQAEVALAAALRGTSLTKSLLAVARRQPMDPKPQDLNSVLAELAPLIRHTAGPTIKVEEHLGARPAVANIDRGGFDSAILNLVVNARDAMPAGGKLTVSVYDRDLADPTNPHVELPPGQFVVVEVSDTGKGMSPEVRLRALEPFFTTKPRGRGTGLGLSMVYGFTRQLGGATTVYSEEGRGTSIRMYLPQAAQSAEAVAPAVTDAIPAGTESVLVVDDEPALVDVATQWLVGLGYSVVGMTSADEAYRALKGSRSFDLLFTDIVMPGTLDGLELARLVRQFKPEQRILVTTGFSESHQQKGLPRDVELLRKPYRRVELAHAVRRALDAGLSAAGKIAAGAG